ncbi:hypothetical protein RJT34_19888 [Clitoria ternatea]|uniref:Uncharacterized protein n=1 Tax=Clitoria ternatea TaxID=43366 RepID=A0AAN9IRV1_CLITE
MDNSPQSLSESIENKPRLVNSNKVPELPDERMRESNHIAHASDSQTSIPPSLLRYNKASLHYTLIVVPFHVPPCGGYVVLPISVGCLSSPRILSLPGSSLKHQLALFHDGSVFFTLYLLLDHVLCCTKNMFG